MTTKLQKMVMILVLSAGTEYSFSYGAMSRDSTEPAVITSDLRDFWRDTLAIWRESLRNRRTVSALSASSPAVVRTILQAAHIQPGSNVLEIGSGTGTITKPLARILFEKNGESSRRSPRLNDLGRLDAVEYLEDFYVQLEEQLKDFTRQPVNLYHADFTVWEPIDGVDTTELYDAIIATIPFTQLGQEMLEAILNKALPMLKPGGKFIFISLLGARNLGTFITKTKKFFGDEKNFIEHEAKLNFMDRWLSENFVQTQELVWSNLPPMWVYKAEKKSF